MWTMSYQTLQTQTVSTEVDINYPNILATFFDVIIDGLDAVYLVSLNRDSIPSCCPFRHPVCAWCRMIKILVKFFRTAVWEMIMYEMSCHGHVTMMVSQSACPGVEPLLELMTSILCVAWKCLPSCGAICDDNTRMSFVRSHIVHIYVFTQLVVLSVISKWTTARQKVTRLLKLERQTFLTWYHITRFESFKNPLKSTNSGYIWPSSTPRRYADNQHYCLSH